MKNRSRLSRKIEQQSKKNLFFSLIGIILVVFIIIKFGIPLLVNFSLFVSSPKNDREETKNSTISFVPTPILNPIPSATSSAEVVISGFASPKQNVELYINNQLIDKVSVSDKGTFSFTEKISSGENVIRTKAIIDNKESELSKPISIVLINKPPNLNIDSPVDGESFSKDQAIIDIVGKTDIDAKITINGFWAISDRSGHFSHRLPLASGENKIQVIAEDLAGNKTQRELKVTFSP